MADDAALGQHAGPGNAGHFTQAAVVTVALVATQWIVE